MCGFFPWSVHNLQLGHCMLLETMFVFEKREIAESADRNDRRLYYLLLIK